jgi:hypothetical protein
MKRKLLKTLTFNLFILLFLVQCKKEEIQIVPDCIQQKIDVLKKGKSRNSL